ncbi:PREDICTED: uncharacterized protein LOC109215644 [Nicotiana attenuata]|uniref:uncharacterized protein LOC109215644 n=1 Tax=Nicotiana attenuata TaxID=49451 RepID=UPI000904E39D|nr:PREDICTED: uncharacterized protein LOC109215644 [Nicotiana attenuata]
MKKTNDVEALLQLHRCCTSSSSSSSPLVNGIGITGHAFSFKTEEAKSYASRFSRQITSMNELHKHHECHFKFDSANIKYQSGKQKGSEDTLDRRLCEKLKVGGTDSFEPHSSGKKKTYWEAAIKIMQGIYLMRLVARYI